MTSSKFSLGQKVTLFDGIHENRETTVSKVGRTLVYIEQPGRPLAFRKDDGFENRSSAGYAVRIETLEMTETRERRNATIAALKEHGIQPLGHSTFKQSTDVLEKLLAVLKGTE